ncbi:MAG: hypothetical protein L6R40_006537 [Gallowayella cf. fulva]|nr:MAG: hypothetical protein L6R40_006537 [Xanthomendoza cf. fulva]
MASHPQFDTHLADQKVKTLVNAQLKSILRRERLAVSGVKAAMQRRIIDRERTTFLDSPVGPAAIYADHSTAGPPMRVRLKPPKLKRQLADNTLANPTFKDSPFYTILQHLTPVQECKATRDTIESKITFKPDVADKLISDSSTRVMIFCASEPISHFTKVDIAFPHQVEIKVNLDEVKANLRGLKNRPGSTRPADITHLLRKRANYENSMSLTYALTHKHSVEELVAKLKSGKTISKDQVIREMVSKAQDSDVQATGATISLKCPLSTLRIDVPCRSTVCTHNQCFDATSFLQLQEQAPTWTCPVCNKTVSFEALEIDRSVDQVTVEPDGKWFRISEGDPSPRSRYGSSGDDEDLIEIKDPPRVTAVKNEILNGSNFMRTPPTSSREQSTTSSVPPPSAGAKRSASAVIDLTSDDNDEDAGRGSKRPTTGYHNQGETALLLFGRMQAIYQRNRILCNEDFRTTEDEVCIKKHLIGFRHKARSIERKGDLKSGIYEAGALDGVCISVCWLPMGWGGIMAAGLCV